LAIRWLRAATAVTGALFVLLYVACALVRVQYPFDLEWLEGGILESVRRVTEGRQLFAAPSVDYVAFNYPPFYYYAAAPLMRLLGYGFLPLRLLSFLASLATLGLLVAVVHRLTRDAYAAFLAAALYAACYQLTDAWYDLARADSLYVLLLVMAAAWMVFDRSRVRAGLAVGVWLALACLTKQSAMVAVAVLAVYALAARRAMVAIAVATFSVLMLASFLWLNATSGGWFSFFTLRVAGVHTPDVTRLPYFWMRYVGELAVASALAVAAFLWPPGERDTRRADLAALLAALGVSGWHMSLYGGGARNNGMPVVLAICLLFGLGLHAARRKLAETPAPSLRSAELIVYLACLFQFAGLGYDPRKLLPTAADVAAGRSLVSELAQQPGDVLIPLHNYLAPMAGKPGHFHDMALSDVRNGGRLDLYRQVTDEIQARLETGRYAAVVLDPGNRFILDSVAGFGPERVLFRDPAVLMTRSGSATRPEYIRLHVR